MAYRLQSQRRPMPPCCPPQDRQNNASLHRMDSVSGSESTRTGDGTPGGSPRWRFQGGEGRRSHSVALCSCGDSRCSCDGRVVVGCDLIASSWLSCRSCETFGSPARSVSALPEQGSAAEPAKAGSGNLEWRGWLQGPGWLCHRDTAIRLRCRRSNPTEASASSVGYKGHSRRPTTTRNGITGSRHDLTPSPSPMGCKSHPGSFDRRQRPGRWALSARVRHV